MFFAIDAEPSLTCGALRHGRAYASAILELLHAAPLEAPPPEPWDFTITASRTNPLMLDDYYPAAHLMSRRMLEVLTNNGVSNLQRFDARLTESASGVVHNTHQVVNVVSQVRSTIVRDGQTYAFSFEAWSPALQIFRIASGLVVTRSLADVLRKAGLRHLSIEPLPTSHIDAS